MPNWVIVRVWLPKDGDDAYVVAHAAKNVGHASLETPNSYASFWPNWEVSKKTGKSGALFGNAKGMLVPDLATDIYYEGESPDVEVVLYTLDVTAIEQALLKFKQSSTAGNWSLMGRNIFNIFNGGGGQSCSGLVYDLLKAGGIKKLISWDITSKRWTVAPDAVARATILAASSKQERAAGFTNPLPPTVLHCKRVKKPDGDLNPHTWRIGRYLAEPSRWEDKCTLM